MGSIKKEKMISNKILKYLIMTKVEFLEYLKVENVYSLISDSEIENKPRIDLFDDSISDHEKICNFIKIEFYYAYNVIIENNCGGRQLVLKKFKNIPNKYLKIFHVLTDSEINCLALEMFLNLFLGIEAEYLHFVMEYLEEKAEVLSDHDAYKVLLLMDLNPVEEYRDWFADANPNFIRHDQIEKFKNRAEEIKVNYEASRINIL